MARIRLSGRARRCGLRKLKICCWIGSIVAGGRDTLTIVVVVESTAGRRKVRKKKVE
jgi:hypothetical protein